MWKLLKWFDVGKDWKLGIDRFFRFCCVVMMLNLFLDLLHVLPVDDSKVLIDFVKSNLPVGGGND